MKRTVTVIIPTYKPGQMFAHLLGQLKKQTYTIEKIIVVNTDKDNWNSALKKITKETEVIHIAKADFDHGGTRDMAVRKAETDIVLFMTQDVCLANNDTLKEMMAFFDRKDVKAVYARQLPQKDCKTIEKYTRSFNYPEKSSIKSKSDIERLGIKTFFCSDVCAAYDCETYLQLGGFTKKTIFNEDMIYAGKLIKAGFRVAYASRAEVIHSHNYGLMEQLRRNFDLAVSQVNHPEVFAGIKSESEGIKLVKQTARYLFAIRKPWLLGSLLLTSLFKYVGYWLGKHYRILPKKMIMKLTMNKEFWENFTIS